MSPVIKRYIIECIVLQNEAYTIFVLLIIIHELILIINLRIFYCVKTIFKQIFPQCVYYTLLRFSHLLIMNEHKIFKKLIVKLIVVGILNLHLLFSSPEYKCVIDIPTNCKKWKNFFYTRNNKKRIWVYIQSKKKHSFTNNYGPT